MLLEKKMINIKKEYFVIGLISVIIAIIIPFYIYFPQNPNPSTKFLLFACLIVLFLFFFLILTTYQLLKVVCPNQINLLHPPILIQIWTFLMMAIPGFFIYLSPDKILPKLHISVNLKYLIWGMVIVWFGCLIITVVYFINLRLISPTNISKKISQYNIFNIRNIFISYILIALLTLFLITKVGITYGEELSSWGFLLPFRQWIKYIQNLQYLLIAIIVVKTVNREISVRYMILIVIIQSLLAISSGFIKPMFEFGVVIFLSALSTRSPKRYLGIILVLFLFVILIMIPVIEEIRYEFSLNAFNPRSVVEVIATTFTSVDNTWFRNWEQSINTLKDKIIYRQGVISLTPGIIIQKTPSIYPYEGFMKFLLLPLYIIPRSIWTDKPYLSRSLWFGIEFLNEPTSTISSSAITIFGEGYLYSGVLGVFMVGVILGLLLSVLYKNTLYVGLNSIYISLVPVFLNIEGEFSGMFVNLIQQSLISFILYWLIIKTSGKMIR